MFKRLFQLSCRPAKPQAEQPVGIALSPRFGTAEVEKNLLAGLAFLGERPQFRDVKRGKALALHLQQVAVELAMQRATEQSTEMWRMFLIAAKVAFLSYGPDTTELQRFERDLGGTWVIEDYENFKLTRASIQLHN